MPLRTPWTTGPGLIHPPGGGSPSELTAAVAITEEWVARPIGGGRVAGYGRRSGRPRAKPPRVVRGRRARTVWPLWPEHGAEGADRPVDHLHRVRAARRPGPLAARRSASRIAAGAERGLNRPRLPLKV